MPEWEEMHSGMEDFYQDQDGEVGDITYAIVRRNFDCPFEEFYRRLKFDPVPEYWRRTLYLEWYSDRNGRVVVESSELEAETMGERTFELTHEDFARKDDENQALLDELQGQGLVIEETPIGIAMYKKDEETDDPLQESLDEQNQKVEEAVEESSGEESSDEQSSGEESLDELNYHDPLEGRRIMNLFDPKLDIPPLSRILENEVDGLLENVLERTAEQQIHFRRCSHFTSRMMLLWIDYRLSDEVTDEIKMDGITFDTAEKCGKCVEERNYEGLDAQ